MRINIILEVYKFKVKAFFGALRASRASLALLLVYTLGFIPSVIGFSMSITNAVKQGNINLELYAELLVAIVSALILFVIMLALRGYAVFEYEQNFIFTSPIQPREFLMASMFADFTASLIFVNPVFIFYAIIVLSLGLKFHLALLMLLAILIFIFMLFFLKTSLSIIKILYEGLLINSIILALAFIFLLPALRLLVDFPLKFSSLPYPSTFLAKILLDIIFNEEPQMSNFLGLIFYFSLVFLLFIFASGKNFFPLSKYIPFVSPFDTSMRMQTLKMKKSIKIFSRISLFFQLNLKSRSLLLFLMRKEIIRIMREGSLFAIILLYLIAALISISVRQASQPPQVSSFFPLTLLVGIYSLIVPLMLVSNWRSSEFENLWIPLTSGVDVRTVVRALLYDFILISSAIPALLILILSIFSNTNPISSLILIVSTSMIGCSVNLYVMINFIGKKRRGTPTLLIGWVSLSLSALLLAPTYLSIVLSVYLELGDLVAILLSAAMLIYSALIMRYFLRKMEKSVTNIEI
ncbi:MAG TPA: hypothetical protein ENG81_02520 [Candidatus Bathyarchaeota archaeon]|nr:hypothetical protein [Candidatus Bathyarchaeota archaeon]